MIKEDYSVCILRASAAAPESTGTSGSEGVEESGTTEESEPRPTGGVGRVMRGDGAVVSPGGVAAVVLHFKWCGVCTICSFN
jgi:hypothetical protein